MSFRLKAGYLAKTDNGQTTDCELITDFNSFYPFYSFIQEKLHRWNIDGTHQYDPHMNIIELVPIKEIYYINPATILKKEMQNTATLENIQNAKEIAEDVKFKLKDSGQRQEFSTGAVRDIQENKGQPSLLPMRAMVELSKLYQAGCVKYGKRNWEAGIPVDRYVDSMFRHLAAFMVGDNSEAHLVQMTWNAINMLDTVLRVKDGQLPQSLVDDLPFNEIKLMGDTFIWENENVE